MLKQNVLYVLLITLILFATSSCDDDNSINNSTDISEELTNIVSGNNWIITKMTDSDDDYTNDFAGYIFTFNNDGSVIADNSTNSYTGTWRIENDDKYDDSNDSDDDTEFTITFNMTNYFTELNEDWDILSYSSSKIELIDESDDDEDEYLTFERK